MLTEKWVEAGKNGTGYEYANVPDIEVYLSPDPEHAKYEVWLPVVRKNKVVSP